MASVELMNKKVAETTQFIDSLDAEGFYLYFGDGTSLNFSPAAMDKIQQEYWNRDNPQVECAVAQPTFGKCGCCLTQDKAICEGVIPLLPITDQLSKYSSYETVTMIWKKPNGMSVILRKDLQTVLDQIALLSILKYCTQSEKYAHYFAGVEPYMPYQAITEIIFKNICLAKKAERNAVLHEIERFCQTLLATVTARVRRVGHFAKTDALINAMSRSLTPIQFLQMKSEQLFDKLVGLSFFSSEELDDIRLQMANLESEHVAIDFNLKKLISHIQNKMRGQELVLALDDFNQSVIKHFANEANFLRNTKYVFLEVHLSAHAAFLNKINALKISLDKFDDVQLNLELDYLGKWLKEHVQGFDADYIDYFHLH